MRNFLRRHGYERCERKRMKAKEWRVTWLMGSRWLMMGKMDEYKVRMSGLMGVVGVMMSMT